VAALRKLHEEARARKAQQPPADSPPGA
jgi:hypothetical protein